MVWGRRKRQGEGQARIARPEARTERRVRLSKDRGKDSGQDSVGMKSGAEGIIATRLVFHAVHCRLDISQTRFCFKAGITDIDWRFSHKNHIYFTKQFTSMHCQIAFIRKPFFPLASKAPRFWFPLQSVCLSVRPSYHPLENAPFSSRARATASNCCRSDVLNTNC